MGGRWRGQKCERGAKRPKLMAEKMKRVFFGDTLNKNNDDERVENKAEERERNTPVSCL